MPLITVLTGGAGKAGMHLMKNRLPDAPRSITIAADTCVEAGMISTLAMLKGAEAENFLAAQEVVSWCRR